MGTDDRVQVKSLSRNESSASSSSSSSSSSSRNRDLGDSELIESSTPLNVPLTTTNEQSSNNMIEEQALEGNIWNRVPSSIFSSKPAVEWSIASNESLFSIHIGTNSLSKEQFLSMYKTGEFTKLDEQIIAHGDVMPSLKELEEMAAMEESVGNDCLEAKETPTMVVGTNEVAKDDDHSHEMKVPAEVHNLCTSSVSGISDESTFSFVFPVLSGTEGQEQGQEQDPEPEPEPEQCTEEPKPQTPENATSPSWFSCFRCFSNP
ncbi:uncharacterized protein LOC120140990 [Hibiscus syriacus]|uniref:uncharacterized protein LOC120140990 n=1 Tax=Hibiscus syriacus TaxID=106335 RepID=UPI001923D10A|nr:uncharacterized protein LOC120140990 [Hibiscus syriacus]